MTAIDIGIAVFSLLIAIFVLIRSPLHRATVSECLFHPFSKGWIEFDQKQVTIHRGESLPDHLLKEALSALNQAQTALESASREMQIKQPEPSALTAEENRGLPMAAAKVATAVDHLAGYLSNGASSRAGGE